MYYSLAGGKFLSEYRPVHIFGTPLPILTLDRYNGDVQSSAYIDILVVFESNTPSILWLSETPPLERHGLIECDKSSYRVTAKGVHAIRCTYVTMLITRHPLCDVLDRWLVGKP